MANKVETISRLAQWKQYSFFSESVISDAFKIGIWNWHLGFERNEKLRVRLFLQPSGSSKNQTPLARFIMRVTYSGQRKYDSPVEEKVFCDGEEYIFSVKHYTFGRFVIEVEFLDLKISKPDGTETWPIARSLQTVAAESTHSKVCRMLHDSIHADITITTTNGSIKAHKAILASSSPVFYSMFNHNLKENESSTINIEDMSQESCMTFISYLYGDVNPKDFLEHRLAVLRAANKYDIADLKDICEESLLEDINLENALGRLQESWLYQLHRLKRGCFRYLFEFGKIHDIQAKFSSFLKDADPDLSHDMFLEFIRLSKNRSFCNQ